MDAAQREDVEHQGRHTLDPGRHRLPRDLGQPAAGGKIVGRPEREGDTALEVPQQILDVGIALVTGREHGLPPFPFDRRVESVVDSLVQDHCYLAGQARVGPTRGWVEVHVQRRSHPQQTLPPCRVEKPAALEVPHAGQVDRLPPQVDALRRERLVDPGQHTVRHVAQAGGEIVVDKHLERRISRARPAVSAQLP